MYDVFGNVDVIITNAKQDKTGLIPEDDKIGRVIFKPKEDQWRMVTYADAHSLKHGPSAVYQVTTIDNYPLRFGIGVIENDELTPYLWIVRDTNNELYCITNFYEDKIRIRLPFLPDSMIEKLNTISLIYVDGVYKVSYANSSPIPIDSHGVFSNATPVYFVDFDTTLRAAFIGDVFVPAPEQKHLITERPNYFIKDYDE